MVETYSQMLALGTQAPEFSLKDAVSGKVFSLKDFAGHPSLVVMFICNHCPFVKHILDELTRFANESGERGVGIIAINSNSFETHPQDSPPHMKELAVERGWKFPFLFDEIQGAAKAYRAACTPDFFVFDGTRRLVYRGQFDDSRPGNKIPVTGKDLRGAVDSVLAGKPAPHDQKPSIGCNIKWKPGNEPDYFRPK
jgi:thiol-disulfide isomerase/thioredoxin